MLAKTPRQPLRNLLDLPRAISPSAALSALVAVLVGYSGPLLVLFQAAEKGGLTQPQLSSWIWAVTVGCGLCAILLSLWYRQPVLCAWGSAGAVLMVTGLTHFPLPEAIGAYIVAAVAVILVGVTGVFTRIMNYVPRAIVGGMLAGVLFRFAIGLFSSLPASPLLVLAMIATFFILKRAGMRAPSLGALAIGLLIAGLGGDIKLGEIRPELTQPVFTAPVFSLEAIISLSLPLFILTHTSQNAPGVAVLRNAGYDTPPDGPITLTGIASLITAPFGGHGINISALTAAICVNPEAHPDATKRYSAGVAYGLWYILFGIFGSTVVALFTAVPKALIASVAGLSLLSAITNSLVTGLDTPAHRDGALVAFMLTVSDIALLGIGAPFWGLLAGVIVDSILRFRRATT